VSKPRRTFGFLTALLLGAVIAFPGAVQAQTPPPSSQSLLEQLSNETQQMYQRVRVGIVRVQLPTPQWLEQINEQAKEQKKFFHKWGTQLSPQVKEQLIREQQNAQAEAYRRLGTVAASQPTTRTSSAPATQPLGELQFPGRLHPPEDPGNLVLVATGILMDNDGHVVVPLYVEREVVGKISLRVLMGDGKLTTAKFVGSDRKTNLTVLQLENRTGQPVALARSRPDDGVLTLVIASDGGARLVVWTNLHPEPGLIVMPDGSVAGFGFNGQFLGAAASKPIVDQIIATGEVHRAVLGVKVREIRKDDVLRQHVPALGNRSAIRVEEVDGDSAAARGGLRVGDLILTVAGQPVGDAPTFAAVIATRDGQTALQVLRGSDQLELTVDLQPK
jgi:S1-C subfamily serine protease